MDTKSCSSHASAKSVCPSKQRCYPASAENKIGDVVIWIVAVDANPVHLFLQHSGRPIEPFSVGCCCSKEASSSESLAKYLDTALVCRYYTGLVLVGSEAALKTIKGLLSPSVHNRVIAEILDDVAGKDVHELMRSISERIAL